MFVFVFVVHPQPVTWCKRNLQVEVKGRAQQLGQTFCSRINYMKLIGTPLRNMTPGEAATESNCNALVITPSDPLEQRGGIRKCSENGRTAADDKLDEELDNIMLGAARVAKQIADEGWPSLNG